MSNLSYASVKSWVNELYVPPGKYIFSKYRCRCASVEFVGSGNSEPTAVID